MYTLEHGWTCRFHNPPCTWIWTHSEGVCSTPISPFFPKAMEDILMKSEHVYWRMSPIVTQCVLSFLETMLMITPNLGYGMAILQQHNTRPWVWCFPIFLWSVVSVAGLCCTIFENMEVGRASGFGGIWKHEQGIGSVAIVEILRRSERAFLCCNWNPASLSANASSLKRVVPIFNGHVLGNIG